MTEQYTPDSCAIGDDTLMIDVFVLEISKKNIACVNRLHVSNQT